ncbi:MAG TPA: hypothetical protein P5557_13880, partial [Candidatus Sumerlaeia bacterium]|nr:hypothetical protein [Candidatus Sumerlaeia bacterium]
MRRRQRLGRMFALAPAIGIAVLIENRLTKKIPRVVRDRRARGKYRSFSVRVLFDEFDRVC